MGTQTLRLGALPEPGGGRLAALPQLHTLLPADLPPVPVSMTAATEITHWGMLGNALWGDCVAAGVLHTIHAWTHRATGRAGVHGTVEQALAFYRAVTLQYPRNYPAAFDPSDPSTDNGLVPSDAFAYWYRYGVDDGSPGRDFILGFASLRTGADAYLDTQRSVAWSGAAGNAFMLPNSAMDQFDAGEPWDVIPDDASGEAGGHFAPTLAYDGDTAMSSTWAKLQPTTAAFYTAYMTGGIIAVSPDAFDRAGVNPDGLDLATLQEAMVAFTGRVWP